ncbi:MAG: AAA family ATPase [Bacteroidetes bacterium]|nr:AAA family ATPase [Bacteroidota bacterium]
MRPPAFLTVGGSLSPCIIMAITGNSPLSLLKAFINHGTLPFVGRAAHIERIVRFWQETFEAQGLRVALLTGEAGVGKSRLIDEAITVIRDEGGAVVHAHLAESSGTSLAATIAEALRTSAETVSVAGPPADERLATVIAALQRIARLRPTLVVLEDIHLLNGDALGDCSRLLQALTDEAVSILCIARSVNFTPRGILERYLVEEIAMSGLGRGDIEELWTLLFDVPLSNDALTLLSESTQGNPLALRSSLMVVATTLIAPGTNGNNTERPGEPGAVPGFDELERCIHESIRDLAGGMAAHLTEEERLGASRFACLGEVFSVEAAQIMDQNAVAMLERLEEVGIIGIASTVPAPIVGNSRDLYPASNFPLHAFTHSLLHRYFAHNAEIDDVRLATAIASNAPLYSFLPFQLLAMEERVGVLPVANLQHAVTRCIGAAYILDESPEWRLALPVYSAAARLAARLDRARMPEEELLDIDLRLAGCRLSLLRRGDYGTEYRTVVVELLERTANPSTDLQARWRLLALTHWHRMSARTDHEVCFAVWDEVRNLVERFGGLLPSVYHILYLRDVAQFARRNHLLDLGRSVEACLHRAMSAPGLSAKMRDLALRTIMPAFLTVFTTAGELDERLRLYYQLNALADETAVTCVPKLDFLLSIGMMEEARDVAARGMPRIMELNLARSRASAELAVIHADAVLGTPLRDVEHAAEHLPATVTGYARDGLREQIGYMLITAGLLRGEYAWAGAMLDSYPEAAHSLSRTMSVLIAIERNDRAALAALASDGRTPGDPLAPLLAAVVAGEPVTLGVLAPALPDPVLRVADVLAVAAAIDLASTAINAAALRTSGAGHDVLRDALGRAAAWLCLRKLGAALSGLARRYGSMLDERERQGLAAAVASLPQSLENGAETRRPLVIAMLGSISATLPNGERIRIRGARLRVLLALMVADMMLEQPLRHREFCHIATGNYDAADHARKVVNISVYRLRELLGQEIILTNGETPRLNPERVEVDLIKAAELLDEVEESVAKGALVRAHRLLATAFEIVGAGAPFPDLAEPFFEAARRDFEGRLRTASIDVARGLLFERDAGNARIVLAAILAIIPDDAELIQLMRQAGNIPDEASASQ